MPDISDAERKLDAIAWIESAGREFADLIRELDTSTLGYKAPSGYADRACDKVEEAVMWARRAYLGFGEF